MELGADKLCLVGTLSVAGGGTKYGRLVRFSQMRLAAGSVGRVCENLCSGPFEAWTWLVWYTCLAYGTGPADMGLCRAGASVMWGPESRGPSEVASKEACMYLGCLLLNFSCTIWGWLVG